MNSLTVSLNRNNDAPSKHAIGYISYGGDSFAEHSTTHRPICSPMAGDVPTLDPHIRQIRNIQFICLDLEPLLPGSTKLQSTTINAYAAYAQSLECNNAFSLADFVIFSSWLACIATKNIKDDGPEGSFAVHVMAAVSATNI